MSDLAKPKTEVSPDTQAAATRFGMIGVVVENLESSYITEVIRGIDAELSEAGWNLILCTTHLRDQTDESFVTQLSVGFCDGLLVLLPTRPERYSEQLAESDLPFVVLDHIGSDIASSLVAQNEEGAYAATMHLGSLGHRRIGFVTGELSMASGRDRLLGYKRALAELGADTDPTLIVTANFLESDGRRAAHQLLDLAKPPTAIFASSDASAFGVIKAAASRGLRVPNDLSVVGFDDIPEAASILPPLTTVRQPIRDMGRIGARMLLERVSNPDTPVQHEELPTELIIRRSTRQPTVR